LRESRSIRKLCLGPDVTSESGAARKVLRRGIAPAKQMKSYIATAQIRRRYSFTGPPIDQW
jgi:hypothetical protein